MCCSAEGVPAEELPCFWRRRKRRRSRWWSRGQEEEEGEGRRPIWCTFHRQKLSRWCKSHKGFLFCFFRVDGQSLTVSDSLSMTWLCVITQIKCLHAKETHFKSLFCVFANIFAKRDPRSHSPFVVCFHPLHWFVKVCLVAEHKSTCWEISWFAIMLANAFHLAIMHTQ